jgi:diacylglycerol diphosphate phosphatase/phosphatidate phosphatase
MGLGYALATSTLFQAFIKLFVGGLRPHFLSICAPAIPPPGPGMMTPGPMSGVFYKASQVCTGDGNKVREAQMSFPSGHACAAFAGFGFLALWMNAKFKVFGEGRRSGFPHAQNTPNTAGETNDESGNNEVGEKDERGGGRIQHWKFVLFATPWCLAFLLAGSKVRDEWHHPVDVIFGALVGTAFAHLAYRMVYRSIYNSRKNHIPREH